MPHHRTIVAVIIGSYISPCRVSAQPVDSAKVAAIVAQERELAEQGKAFKFGLSLGYRHLQGSGTSFFRDATLNPADSTVEVEKIDLGAMVLSGVVVAYPWKRPTMSEPSWRARNAWRVGFIANFDLASFANAEVSTFNKSIEGGGGLAVRMSDDFSLALTFERVLSRRLWAFVKPGAKLPVAPGAPPGSFNRDNDLYFRNDNLSAVSVKFVYFIR